MKNSFIGREKEQAILHNALASNEAEMVAVIGRRRVGKTSLVKIAYAEQLDFEVTGVQNAPLSEQLQSFAFRINTTFYNGKAKLRPRNWLDAFQMLILARALSQKWKGLSRQELLDISRLPNGGNTTLAIEELISSGFVTPYYPFGKTKKEILYRLTDEYSLFYLHFIENHKQQGKNIWQDISQTQLFKSWSGFAFESLCFKHLDQIKKALGISGIYAEASSLIFRGNDTEQGMQIDMLIARKDQIINLFEIKFYNETWQLDKADAVDSREKMAAFRRISKTKKHVFMTIIATYGIRPNAHSLGLVDRVIDLDTLFDGV